VKATSAPQHDATTRLKENRLFASVVGEPIEVFALCQSLASRYGRFVTNGSPPATGTFKPRLNGLCREDAVQLPRLTWVALGQKAIHFLSHEQSSAPKPIGKVVRRSLNTEIKRGLLWTRVTIIDPPKKRSYTIFISKLTPGGRNLLTALRATP
jgi:hypothetical protein